MPFGYYQWKEQHLHAIDLFCIQGLLCMIDLDNFCWPLQYIVSNQIL